MTRVVIVMPYFGQERFRQASWVAQRLRLLHPEWPLIVATDGGTPPTKARAANRAVPTDADVIVVTDADVAVPQRALTWAIRWVEQGAAWAVPAGTVYRLTPEHTAVSIARSPAVEIEHLDPDTCIPNRPPYDAVPGGGTFAVGRDAWETVGGFDERFQRQEDVPLAHALDTLAGPHEQLPAPCWHFWHPHPRVTSHLYRDQALEARYLAARGKPDVMAALVGETSTLDSGVPGA